MNATQRAELRRLAEAAQGESALPHDTLLLDAAALAVVSANGLLRSARRVGDARTVAVAETALRDALTTLEAVVERTKAPAAPG